MPDPRRLRSVVGLVAILVLVLAGVGATGARPTTATEAALPAWTGGVNLYRTGVFTTQKSWLWCTAAGVQIIRNIVDQKGDHTASGQRRYFSWMRDRNHYDLPLSAGVDPAGWAAGLRHFVDARYRLVSSRTFDGALRSAVTRLRLTGLPVALTVSHGNHGWILTGFRATADPATTSTFTVTSVRVTGPLYGLQSKNGYDMAPNTKLTTDEFKRFFTPWKYKPMPMIWDGRYVSIQPVPTAGAADSAGPAPRATASPSHAPNPSLERSAGPSLSPGPASTATLEPAPETGSTPAAVAIIEPDSADQDPTATSAHLDGGPAGPITAVLLAIAAFATAVIVANRLRRRGKPTPRA